MWGNHSANEKCIDSDTHTQLYKQIGHGEIWRPIFKFYLLVTTMKNKQNSHNVEKAFLVSPKDVFESIFIALLYHTSHTT